MKISRRQWLKRATAVAVCNLLPMGLFASPAAAIAKSVPIPGGLGLLLEAGDINLPLRRGIEAIAGTTLGTSGPRNDFARLDKLVEELRLWRGGTLLGMVPAYRALLLDEALRELGAIWLSRGEHVQLPDGNSRHRLMSSSTRSGQVEILRVEGCQHCSAAQWAELLGTGMAKHAMFPGSAAPVLPLLAHIGSSTSCQQISPAAAPAVSSRFISFVTRI